MKSNEKLAKTLALGRKRYILYHGVFGWGLLTAAIFTIWSFYSKERMGAADIVIPFIAFPMGGILWGAFMWFFLEKKYNASLEQNSR